MPARSAMFTRHRYHDAARVGITGRNGTAFRRHGLNWDFIEAFAAIHCCLLLNSAPERRLVYDADLRAPPSFDLLLKPHQLFSGVVPTSRLKQTLRGGQAFHRAISTVVPTRQKCQTAPDVCPGLKPAVLGLRCKLNGIAGAG